MHRFDPDRYYATTDPDLRVLGTRDAIAKKRSRGEGPRYHRVGRRVLYLGADLNAFLDGCAVDPTSGPGRAGRAEARTSASAAGAGAGPDPQAADAAPAAA